MHDINKLNSENIGSISSLFFSAIFQTFFCTLDIVLPYTKYLCKLYLFHTYCSFQLVANFWLVLIGLQFIYYFL